MSNRDSSAPAPSDPAAVREMYEASAVAYAQMMDDEIGQPLYVETLERLMRDIRGVPGAIVDVACGSGHMLEAVARDTRQDRALVGVDLSPHMVAITARRVGPLGRAIVGNMTRLEMLPDASAAAVINFFALHHVDPAGVRAALREARRILVDGGTLTSATWEGVGPIDYGEHSDIVALRYRSDELRRWAEDAGLAVTHCVVKPVDGFPMDAIYLSATATAKGAG